MVDATAHFENHVGETSRTAHIDATTPQDSVKADTKLDASGESTRVDMTHSGQTVHMEFKDGVQVGTDGKPLSEHALGMMYPDAARQRAARLREITVAAAEQYPQSSSLSCSQTGLEISGTIEQGNAVITSQGITRDTATTSVVLQDPKANAVLAAVDDNGAVGSSGQINNAKRLHDVHKGKPVELCSNLMRQTFAP